MGNYRTEYPEEAGGEKCRTPFRGPAEIQTVYLVKFLTVSTIML